MVRRPRPVAKFPGSQARLLVFSWGQRSEVRGQRSEVRGTRTASCVSWSLVVERAHESWRELARVEVVSCGE